jgi:hypothetical protein
MNLFTYCNANHDTIINTHEILSDSLIDSKNEPSNIFSHNFNVLHYSEFNTNQNNKDYSTAKIYI